MPNTYEIGTKFTGKFIKGRLAKELTQDVKNMTEKQFRQHASRLFSAVNKRIKRIESSDTLSPALDALKKSGHDTHFAVRGKSGSALVDEYNKALAFYNLKTSTLSGSREFTNKLKNQLGDYADNKEMVGDIFDLLHSIQERMPTNTFKGVIGSDDVLQEIQEIYEQDVDETLSAINNNKYLREDFIMRVVNNIVSKIQAEQFVVTVENFGNGRLF